MGWVLKWNLPSSEKIPEFIEVTDHVILDESDFYSSGYWKSAYDPNLLKTCVEPIQVEPVWDAAKNKTVYPKVEQPVQPQTLCQKGYAWTKNPGSVKGQVSIRYTMNITACNYPTFDKLSQTANMLGILFGLPLAGLLGDKFGRKYSHIFCCYGMIAMFYALTLCQEIWNFIGLQFLTGFLAGMAYDIRCVLFTEVHHERWRLLGSTMCCMGFGFIYCWMPFIAYLLPVWYYQIYCYIGISLACCLFLWFIPESSQWLRQNGRILEAKEIEREVCSYWELRSW